MPSFDATILFYCIDFILNLYSTAKKKIKKKTVAKKTPLNILWFVVLFRWLKICCCNNILFYYALYASSATKLYRIGNISVFFTYLALVCILSLLVYISTLKFKEGKTVLRTMIIIFFVIVTINDPFFSFSVSLHIFNAFILKEKKTNKNI